MSDLKEHRGREDACQVMGEEEEEDARRPAVPPITSFDSPEQIAGWNGGSGVGAQSVGDGDRRTVAVSTHGPGKHGRVECARRPAVPRSSLSSSSIPASSRRRRRARRVDAMDGSGV